MTGRLLDTSVLIDLVFARSANLKARYAAELHAATQMSISAVSVFEFRFGAERSRRREFQLAALDRFLTAATVIDFDHLDAQAAALLKADLAAKGTPIGAYDLLIAAQARARALAVVTGNLREFSQVQGLVVENWSQSTD